MNSAHEKSEKKEKEVQSNLKIELSSLVGHDILIISDQFVNTPLYSKVVLAQEGVLSIDRGGSNGMIDKLENDQVVLIQFSYKGQRIGTKATVTRSMGGRCNLTLHDCVTPLNRRMFKRYSHTVKVRCAILPAQNVDPTNFAKLRWITTESKNLSSGGILLPLSTQLTEHTKLILNIDYDKKEFPGIVIGEVRYALPAENFKYDTGIHFIVDEHKDKHFPTITLKRIPQKAFEYTTERRKLIDKILSTELSDKQE
ncbi:MAG: hypothetical protein DWP97_00090 [Calditrichaeota bacterium]|nr:MAG: hypothetical protein DWP97_00090 [Calditrichota bacterium]